jgi:hypothetical protein
MFNSGNRQVQEGRVNVEAGDQNAALTREDQQSALNRDNANAGADSELAKGKTGIYAASGQRRLNDYRAKYGI